MKKHVKDFCLRGLIFGGFGPIIAAIIYFFISLSMDINFSGKEILIVIISTYLLAFIQAGASIFNQFEDWPALKSAGIHLGIIYCDYILCYLVNSWIPFDWLVILIFTIIFVIAYAIIWLTVYLIVRNTAKKLNDKIS